MNYRSSRLAVFTVIAAILVLCRFGVAWAADQKVTGIVAESGYSGVVLKAPGERKGVKYNTGRETTYNPADYRPVKGDTVTLAYYRKLLGNGKELLAVSSITLVKKESGRKELTSPAMGVVREAGRKMMRIEFPATGQVITMDKKRGMDIMPPGWVPAAGDRVKVYYEKVPARFGPGVVHVIGKLEKAK